MPCACSAAREAVFLVDYRLLGFQRNWGLRIDHILLSRELAARCTASTIDREPRKRERPSDHAPVIADLS